LYGVLRSKYYGWTGARTLQSRAPCSYEEVDSDAFAPSERFALWRETGRLPMTAEPADAEGRQHFHIHVRRLSGVSGRFADLTASPMKLSREDGHYRRDGLDMVSLTLMLGPHVQHQFGAGREVNVVQTGQVLIKDFTRPATAWWKTSSRSLNLHLPRVTVQAAIGDKIKNLHGTVLSPEGLAPMLQAQLLNLANLVPRLNNALRAAALDATVDLAASVLRCEFGARIEDEENNTGLYAAAQLLIERHLASHQLNPELIARQLRCSRAHLYRVFAAKGESVANYVRELRLKRAHDLLARRDVSKEQISDIAYGCGFEDPVHFTRLFRQRFGLTPSELRSSVASPSLETGRPGRPTVLLRTGALRSWIDAVTAAILFSEILL
jgi:AraC-like DNA-binding protein